MAETAGALQQEIVGRSHCTRTRIKFTEEGPGAQSGTEVDGLQPSDKTPVFCKRGFCIVTLPKLMDKHNITHKRMNQHSEHIMSCTNFTSEHALMILRPSISAHPPQAAHLAFLHLGESRGRSPLAHTLRSNV